MDSAPYEISSPHEVCGGCTPRPRKLRNASSSITEGIVSVVYTMIGPSALGTTWRRMIAAGDRPSEIAASTNSCWRRLCTCARMMRAIVSHSTAPMARNSSSMLRPNTTISSTMKIMNGSAYRMSTMRIITASTRPPA